MKKINIKKLTFVMFPFAAFVLVAKFFQESVTAIDVITIIACLLVFRDAYSYLKEFFNHGW